MKNIVFITVDSLRADYVFGSKAPSSLETLPQLARNGVRFTNAFSNAAYTKGSFLSILSGTYPWMFESTEVGFGPDRPHIAELLSDAGYTTAGFHTNTYLSPTYNYDRGFDYYLGRDAASDDGTKKTFEVLYSKLTERAVSTQGISNLVHQTYTSVGKHLGIQLGSSLYKPAAELNDAAVEWAQQATQPAFLWIHYMDVHNPYYPHEGTVSEDISRKKAIKLFHKATELEDDTPQEDVETLETLYRGEIEYFDRQLGSLLERLDTALDLDNTMVVFTSDHGEAFNEKGHLFHPGHVLYDENVHIPIIIQDRDAGQGDVSTPVSNVDLVPTILSKAGIEQPSSIAGKDITSFLGQNEKDRRVYAEAYGPDDGHVMVTDGRYKLIRHLETGDEELYDRHESPPESHDVSEERPEIYDRISETLDEHIEYVNESHGRSGDVEVTEDVRLQLKKLGYDE